MTLQQLYDLASHPTTWVVVVAVLMSLVEVSKIKINPWSWIFKKIGGAINKEVIERLKQNDKKTDELRTSVDLLKGEIDKRAAVDARTNILRFDDELYNGMKHSKEYFVQELDDIDTYEKYCDAHPDFKNSCAVEAIKHIRAVYGKCLEEHKFI